MIFSEHKLDPTTINGTKYRVAKFNVITTSAEGFKLLSAVAPSLGVMADIKLGKSDIQKELDEIYTDTHSNEFVFTQAITHLQQHLTEEHFLELQDKLLKSLEMKDEQKDEWVKVDWIQHLSSEEYESDYLELLIYAFRGNLLSFFMKQVGKNSMFRSVIETVSPMLNKMKTQFQKDSAPQDTNEAR